MQILIKVVLLNGYKVNDSDKCIYNKFDDNLNGVIVCLYVDDMLILETITTLHSLWPTYKEFSLPSKSNQKPT